MVGVTGGVSMVSVPEQFLQDLQAENARLKEESQRLREILSTGSYVSPGIPMKTV